MFLEHEYQKTARWVNNRPVISEEKRYRWWSNDKKVCESGWFSSIEAAMLWANAREEK